MDSRVTYYNLREFRDGMEKIRGVLEDQLEDDMAEFSAEEFIKMERESQQQLRRHSHDACSNILCG